MRYRVDISEVHLCSYFVEADNEEEALEMVRGGEFDDNEEVYLDEVDGCEPKVYEWKEL